MVKLAAVAAAIVFAALVLAGAHTGDLSVADDLAIGVICAAVAALFS